MQPTCGSLFGALSNGSRSTLMVPLLPGGFGAAPAICVMVMVSATASRPTSHMLRFRLLRGGMWISVLPLLLAPVRPWRTPTAPLARAAGSDLAKRTKDLRRDQQRSNKTSTRDLGKRLLAT